MTHAAPSIPASVTQAPPHPQRRPLRRAGWVAGAVLLALGIGTAARVYSKAR